MIYRVEFAPRADDDVDNYVGYIEGQSKDPVVAERVFNRLMNAAASLDVFPRRCPIAPEDEITDYEVRALIVGSFLLLFNVDDDARLVKIVAARHGRQLPLTDL